MRPGVPWNVKDISSEAREAAQVAAQRAGLSLGEWLANAIASESKTVAAHESQAALRAQLSQPFTRQQPAQAPQHPQPQQQFYEQPQQLRTALATATDGLHAQTRNSEFMVVAHGLRDLADRIESSELRQNQAINAINQNVAAMAGKVDAADRIKLMAETAFSSAAEAINKSTRDQSAAFESLESTVKTMSERLQLVETQGSADPIARETVTKLEGALDNLKSRLGEAERRGQDAQASLDSWVKSLTTRIDAVGQETSELIRNSTQGLELSLTQVRTDIAESERRQREKAQALATIQHGLNAIRNEITETDKRSRDAVGGLERWVKELHGRLDHTEASSAELTMRLSDGARGFASVDQLQALGDNLNALRADLRIVAESSINDSATRDRSNKETQASLDAAIRRLANQVQQTEGATTGLARSANESVQALTEKFSQTETIVAKLRQSMDTIEARVAQAVQSSQQGGDDGPVATLRSAVEQLSENVSKSEQANAQTAQRQAAAIRKVEDMLQGFARGLDTVGDISKGPLSQPMAAVQATLETITAKIEDSDKRAAESIHTIESALKTFAARIDDSERRQAQSAAQIDASLKTVSARLDDADRREGERDRRLDDSFRDVIDRIEDSERKAGDAIDAVDTGMSAISQRIDAADRRHKEAIAGLRLTVDGLVAKAAAEPMLQRTASALQSFAPQQLSTTGPSLPPLLSAEQISPPSSPKKIEASSIAPYSTSASPISEATQVSLPTVGPRFLDMEPAAIPPVIEPLPAQNASIGMSTTALAVAVNQSVEAPPPPTDFDQLLRNAVEAPPLASEAAPQHQPKKADDFLAQARRAAQAAALAEASQPAQQPGRRTKPTDGYAQEGGQNYGRLAIVGVAFVALVAGVIALIALLPSRGTSEDANRPAPGASLGEMMTPEASSAPVAPQQPTAAFTELPPTPDATALNPSSIVTNPIPQSASEFPGAPVAITDPSPVEPTAEQPTAATGDAALEARAVRGDPKAQFILASRYLEGRLVARDPAKAVEWFEKSAQAGLPAAQYRMGELNERGGAGLAKDPTKARVWYEKAALNGNRKAMHNLAVLHAEGIGVPQSYGEAAKWFRRGADFGLTDSQYNLGVLYERGMGIQQNGVEAAKWFAIAAAQGDADAAAKLEAMRKSLSPADVTNAIEAARTFKPKTPSPTANESPQAGG